MHSKSLVAMAAFALAAVPAIAQSGSTDPNSGTASGSGTTSGQSGQSGQTGTTDERTGAAGTAQQQGAALGQDDRDFLRQAAIGGMAEVELGRLATKQAQSDEVKKFGQRMVDDHSRANDELKTIALRLGAEVPRSLDTEHKQIKDRLAKASGASFDREYIQAMQKDHDKTIKLFQKQAQSGKSAELKAFAEKTLPILQEHHQLVQQLQSSVGGGASGTGSSLDSHGDTGTSGGSDTKR